jgi:predicted permease
VQAVFRGNLAYVALPVLAALPGGAGPLNTAALLVMAPLLALYNMAGVTLLLACRQQVGPGMPRRVIAEVLKNPLFWSCVAGGLYGWFGLPMPHWLDRTIGTVGQMSLPLALICIGGALAVTPFQGNRRNATLAALLKTAGQPLLGWLFARWLGLAPAETQIGLIILATPTAAATYTMVTQLGGDEPLAASSVVLSTLFSVVTLAVIVGAF